MKKKRTTNKLIDAIYDIQEHHPRLLLCGSAALVLSGKLTDRRINDIDFVINDKHMNKTMIADLRLRPDRLFYSLQKKDDNYKSFHGFESNGFIINVLCFKNEIHLNKEIITCNSKKIIMQDLDTILFYKTKYNRPKDIKDLDNIANNEIESILAE